jgi:hypothetical protein
MPRNLNEWEVRRKLAMFVTGRLSLAALSKWLIPATWDMDSWAPVQMQELVNETKLRIAEHSNGHWSLTELREKLRPLVASIRTAFRTSNTLPRDQERTHSAGRAITYRPSLPIRFHLLTQSSSHG